MPNAESQARPSDDIVGRMPSSSALRGGRPDRHSLVNFGIGKKLIASLGLLGGLAVFFGASLSGLYLSSWDVSASTFLEWGMPLMKLRASAVPLFIVMFAAHAVALLVVLLIANALFHRVALARAARVALTMITLTFGLTDLASWALLPYLSPAAYLLGPLIGLTSIGLVYLAGRPLHDMWVFTRWRDWDGQRKRVVVVGGG